MTRKVHTTGIAPLELTETLRRLGTSRGRLRRMLEVRGGLGRVFLNEEGRECATFPIYRGLPVSIRRRNIGRITAARRPFLPRRFQYPKLQCNGSHPHQVARVASAHNTPSRHGGPFPRAGRVADT
uniref:Uncharacterized protein n=1 Tax=Ixodes ricinus TaxID=34613 RepID=A0A6B0UPX2_IXORI